jgi:hypothetical protein
MGNFSSNARLQERETPLASFFNSNNTNPNRTKSEDKDVKLQRALETEISKREADIKMLKMRRKEHETLMRAELAANNRSAALQHYTMKKQLDAQINQIQVCTAKLNKELTALYTHKMHASTMALMKQTSRHFVKTTAAAGSVDNAIMYADALADAHSTVEEVSDALDYGDRTQTDETDEGWQQVLQEFNTKSQTPPNESIDLQNTAPVPTTALPQTQSVAVQPPQQQIGL